MNVANEKHVMQIETDYEKLSERCMEVDTTKKNSDIQDIVIKLKNTIRANEDMVGLSANQIGFDKRVMCLNFNGEIRTFVNPIITNAGPLELVQETCHSEPDKTFIRLRHNRVEITYQTPLAKIETVELFGMAARVAQHHIDHLDGLLLSDIGLEIEEDFMNATEEEKQEVISMYLDSLDLALKDINVSIENDEEAKKMSDAVKFMDSVRKGETIVEQVPLTDEEIEELKKQYEKENTEKPVDNN